MRAVLLATMATLMAGTAAYAQTRPAEPPPEDFSGREYVDSTGCVFARVGITATIAWVPRLGPDGKPVCGKEPTFAVAGAPAVTPPPAEDATAGAAAGTAETAPAAVAAAPEPAPKVTKPHGHKARKPAPAGPPTLAGSGTSDPADTFCDAPVRSAARYWISDGRRVTKCGPLAEDGVAFVNGLGAPGLSVAGLSTDPDALAKAQALGSKGYRVTWSNRPLANASTPEVPVAGAHWVQIGAFAEAANTDRALASVRELDLPAARQKVRGGALTAVLAGPFATSAEAEDALIRLRGAGYGQAFTRG